VGLSALGGDDEELRTLAELAAAPDLPPGGRPGRVVRVDRDRVAVTDGWEVFRTDPERSLVDDPDIGSPGLPAIGDWVVLSADDPPGVLALGPRQGRLIRRDPGQPRPQILAVGIDVVILTVPLDRPLSIARVERGLVTALDAGARPVIALTKADLVEDLGPVTSALAPSTRDVPVVAVRAVDVTSATSATSAASAAAADRADDRGVELIRDLLRPSNTGVLLGPSGAGKSTLVNAIVGAPVRVTATVRPGDHKGRHTTATRALLGVPGGGALIDTPGLRALGLWDAVERGQLDAGRLDRYQTLFDELVVAAEEQTLADRNRRRRADRRAPDT
jgi:ribosome biogenesis GTPase